MDLFAVVIGLGIVFFLGMICGSRINDKFVKRAFEGWQKTIDSNKKLRKRIRIMRKHARSGEIWKII